MIYDTKAQNISFSSNGHVNNFTKIDTLFFAEYAGKKPSTKTAAIDTAFSWSLMQLDSSFGFTTKTLAEAEIDGSKLSSFKKIFSTTFYAYADGTLEAPTSMLFFKPKTDSAVSKDFSPLGEVVKHPDLKGYYYLYVKTNIYNNGDKIFALCDSLSNAGLTIIVEPVFVRQLKLDTDPLLPNEWNVANTGQYGGTPGADMKVANVWNMGYTGTGVRVAVIDLGVDLAHPDLQANLLAGYDATGNNSGGAPIYDQYNAHGTECAGIIGEIANTIGGVGVAYNAHIIPIRLGTVAPQNINPNGYITTNDTWESNCFNYAVNNGADIISNSWGGGSQSSQLDAAILNAITNGRGGKGAIVLFAAGNNNSVVQYPAINTNVIAVGASCECDTRKRLSNNSAQLNPGVYADPLGVSCDGEFWWGSNFGIGLDVIAPGVNITTTSFTANVGGGHTDTYIANFNGTYAATPNTAAVLALMLSVNPNLTGQQARNILESNTDKVGGYTYQSNILGQPNGTWCTNAGYGRVNACAAVSQVLAGVLSISGDASFCNTSSTYTIPNLPAGAIVTWSVSPSVIATPSSPNGTQTTLTKNGNGVITLTAVISNLCGGPITITKQNIIVGTPNMTNVTFAQPAGQPCLPSSSPSRFVILNSGGTTTPIEVASAASNTIVAASPGGGNTTVTVPNFWVSLSSGSSAYIKVRLQNSCGWSDWKYLTIPPCSSSFSFAVYPNPATNTITIQQKEKTSATINEVSIFDQLGNLKKQSKYNASTKQAQMNIADLMTGIYFIEISSGKNKERQQLIIQK